MKKGIVRDKEMMQAVNDITSDVTINDEVMNTALGMLKSSDEGQRNSALLFSFLDAEIIKLRSEFESLRSTIVSGIADVGEEI